MATAATSGSRSPAAASGSAETLYPMAQPKFWTMTAEVEPAIPDRCRDPLQVATEQGDVTVGQRRLRATPDSAPHVGGGQRRCVVDAVTHHDHPVVIRLHGSERIQLLRRDSTRSGPSRC